MDDRIVQMLATVDAVCALYLAGATDVRQLVKTAEGTESALESYADPQLRGALRRLWVGCERTGYMNDRKRRAEITREIDAFREAIRDAGVDLNRTPGNT